MWQGAFLRLPEIELPAPYLRIDHRMWIFSITTAGAIPLSLDAREAMRFMNEFRQKRIGQFEYRHNAERNRTKRIGAAVASA
jgi:hypothetical protein